VPDVNGLETLDVDRLKDTWAADVEQIANHYGFDKEQRDKAAQELRHSKERADVWYTDKETTEDRKKYYDELREVQAIESNLGALSFERERAAAKRKDLDVERKELISYPTGQAGALRDAVINLATPEQRKAAGPYVNKY